MKENKNIEVARIPTKRGTVYILYFETESEAGDVVKAFWAIRSPLLAAVGLEEGMLQATRHEITFGDRTSPRKINPGSADESEHPGKTFYVSFNGNTLGLKPEGVEALRQLRII